jgi:hypothetical protein
MIWMKSFSIFVLLFKLFNLIQLVSSEIQPNTECLIHNFEYKYEYLYSSSKNENKESNVFTYPLSKIDDFQKITWKFIPLKIKFLKNQSSHEKSLYFINSGKYSNEYLCGSNKFRSMSVTRGLVKRLKLNKKQLMANLNCYWDIEKVILKNTTKFDHAYLIKNIYSGKPLYAASFFFNIGYYERSVYLWFNEINFFLNKYKWLIDCAQGNFIYS